MKPHNRQGPASAPPGSRWCTVTETADELRVSQWTIRRAVKNGELRYQRVGGAIRILLLCPDSPQDLPDPAA